MACGSNVTRSAWYKFTPTANGDYGGDPGVQYVNVYTGTSLGNLTSVACAQWWGLAFHATAGTPYYLQYFGGGMRVDLLPPVAADFTYTPEDPSTLADVSFAYWNGGYWIPSITGYEWDFGDGTTGTGSPASHRYTHDGAYTVTLTVLAYGGRSNTATKTVQVRTP
jgi:PKD repeat protein